MKPDPMAADATAQFEEALSRTGTGHVVLRLYMAGSTRRSIQAVETVKSLCQRHLAGRYELEVIDLYQQPDRAQEAQIVAAPTLVKEFPPPLRRLIGELTDPDRLLIALDLKPSQD